MPTSLLGSPSGKPAGNITFSSYNLPVLEDGLYQLTVAHTFQADPTSTQPTIPAQTQYFAALGPRYSLDAKEIMMQFPAPKTSGRYYNVLPHIVFNRAILPWERQLDASMPDTPWVTLVSLTHDEISGWQKAVNNPKLLTVQTDTLEKVCNTAQASNIIFPALSSISLVPGESAQEPVNYIDIPEPLLQLVLPKKTELPLLANVRQSADAPPPGEDKNPKYPVVLCNRLPSPGQENTVLLLSLENRTDVYTNLASAAAITGEPTPTNAPKLYRFAVLTYWQFASVTPDLTFNQLLVDANTLSTATNGVFCLPPVGDPNADPLLSKGYVPLPHQTRQGNRMVSWYRGPSLPGMANAGWIPPNPSSIESPDSLVRVYSNIGMFDVTYASAWNLGRSLVLENRCVSQALFEWKRAWVQATKANVPAHLPSKKPAAPLLPTVVADWFVKLGRLEQVPFNYLVPDENLLPQESIQFFSVDPEWVQILLRGAFAVGDIASADETIEDQLFQQIPTPVALTGFLLRSKVVSGWPNLLVNGFNTEPPQDTNPPFESGASPLTQHRYTLGTDTMLCLFEGAIQSVEIFLHPETIHYGVDYLGADPTHGVPTDCYIKYLRDQNGDPIQPTASPCGSDRSKSFELNQWVRIPFCFADCSVVDVTTLSNLLTQALPSITMSPAEFAYQMVEGVPKVRFTLKS